MNGGSWDWSLRVFDHVDVHASDFAASVRFYETVLAPLGIPKLLEADGGACFANLNVVDRRPPTTELHVCFHARSLEAVDAFHRAGVAAGFRSNGEPGHRDYAPGYYAAYLPDPDGNNVEALYRDEGNIGHGMARASTEKLSPVCTANTGAAARRLSSGFLITDTDTADAVNADQLHGFFAGWPVAPSPERPRRACYAEAMPWS